MKNYTGHKHQINDFRQFLDTNIKSGNMLNQGDRTMESRNGQKEHYFHRENDKKPSKTISDWMSRFRPRTSPTIPGSSSKKHKRKENSK